MTPMIDIVFQLIIFFLLTGHLVRQETKMKLPLPFANSGEQDLQKDAPRVTINVQANGTMSLGAGTVSMAELTQRLLERKSLAGDSLEVRIRSDRQVPYQVVEPILLACTKVGIWNVVFAVHKPTEGAQ